MPTALLTKRRKIVLAIAFILAWPATWVSQILYLSQSDKEIFLSTMLVQARDDIRARRRLNTNLNSLVETTVTLHHVTESSGWPFASYDYLTGSYTPEYESWESGWGCIRHHYHWFISNNAYSKFTKSILESDNQKAINAINGIYPSTGPQYLGWIGNIVFWWFASYVGIALTLTFARGTDKATHIPKELIQQNRALQGLCPHCSYDIRALDENQPCPECGKKPSDIAISEARKNLITGNGANKEENTTIFFE